MANRQDETPDDHLKREKTAIQELEDYFHDPTNHLYQFVENITRRVKAAHVETKQLSEKCESKLERIVKENQVIQKRLVESEKTRERYRHERNDLRIQIEKFSREVKHNASYEKSEQLRRELEELRNMYEQKDKEWERKLKESEDSSDEIIRVQKQKIEQMEQDIKKQDLKTKGLEELMERSKFSFSDIGKLRKKLEDSEKQLNDTNNRLYLVSSKLKETEKELDDTKTRLSKAMGDKLTDNNPNIADLSDKNRPTKLAEKYAELYDNQWTDAFEKMEDYFSSDEDIIATLLQILLGIEEFCKRMAKRQMLDLEKALSYSDSPADGSVPVYVMKQLKDCRKVMASVSKEHIYALFLSTLRKETGALKYGSEVKPFVKECIEICWLMTIQDPPVVFGPLAGRGKVFHTEVYKPYLRSGPYIEFVVWPAMFLHANGPVLAKGVAQGYGEKIQRPREAWTDSVGQSVASRHVKDKVYSKPFDMFYTYDKGNGTYGSISTKGVREYSAATLLDQGGLTFENTRYTRSGRDSHNRTRSAEERKPAYVKTSERISSQPFVASKPPYERDLTQKEMEIFSSYYECRDYIGARNVLGVKVYERCLSRAKKKDFYF